MRIWMRRPFRRTRRRAPVRDATGWGAEIAAFNAPDAVTIAGPADCVARVVAAAKARRFPAVVLGLDYAFHSAAMAATLAGAVPP